MEGPQSRQHAYAGDRGTSQVREGRRDRLVGLTLDPGQIFQIRQKRGLESPYASLERCGQEVEIGEWLCRTKRIQPCDTTVRSIEQITATISENAHLERRLD